MKREGFMDIKVCKFGGTSMADGNVIRAAAKIAESDETRRYIVVSAPGKRFGGDVKVTDLLYKCFDLLSLGDREGFETEFSKIRTRFLGIERSSVGIWALSICLMKRKKPSSPARGGIIALPRGEYLAARIMAGVLGVPFVDAKTLYCLTTTEL